MYRLPGLLLLAAVCLLTAIPSARAAAGLDSDVNTIQADLRDAAKHDFVIYHNDLFPGFLFRTRAKTLRFFGDLEKVGLSAPTRLAWCEGGVVKSAKAPGRCGPKLGAPWLLAWFHGATGWEGTRYIRHGGNRSKSFDPNVGPIDVPWLVILQRPAAVSLDAQGLAVEGAAPLGDVVFLPLFGSEKLRPEATAAWETGLPAAVIARARQWTALSRRFPLYVREDYQVDEPADAVRIRNTFDYLAIQDAWGTKPSLIAPVPPVVALAAGSKFRVSFDLPPTDLGMVTHWGPYWAVQGKVAYTYTVKGILKYADEVEVPGKFREDTPGFQQARELLLNRIANAARGGADPRRAYSIDWGMGMLGAWMRAMKHLPADLRANLAGYIRRENLLDGFFLSPEMYNEVPVAISPRKQITVVCVKPRQGLQTYGDDLVKQTSRMPYVVWQYGYYSGDWESVRRKYDMVKRMYGFNLLLGWSNVGPEYTAEHAKISAKQGPIGLARLAKQFGDPSTYDYAAYLLAKALINEWAWDVAAVPYATKHAPWFHNTGGDWIIHENHGYVGLQGLPMDQANTYSEIPLVLDRFNREELWGYNDAYVRMRHKYMPNEHLHNVYVTDLGDAPDLASLLKKAPNELLSEDILKSQSHLTPLFYHYPIDLMELACDFSYQRLYPKAKLAGAWHRGLDALSRGQSWRQMAIALRKDWGTDGSKNPWPYPAWYLMNPPEGSDLFVKDALPFGSIQPDPARAPKQHRESRPNWNSYLGWVDLQ